MTESIALQDNKYPLPNKYNKVFKGIKKNYGFCLMILPMVALIVIFNYIPLYGIQIAFKDFKYDLGITGSQWVGFDNFRFLLTSGDLPLIVRNTVLFNIMFIVAGTFVSICMALMLYEIKSKLFVKMSQTIMFFPYFLSWVVVGLILYSLLNPDYGLINNILSMFNISPVAWYERPELWPAVLLISSIWKGTGYGSILYYATLIGIDKEYFEAAKIDGATKLQMVQSISLPFLKPIITVMLLVSIGGLMRSDFGMFFFLPRDMPTLYPTTRTIDTYTYAALRNVSDYGIPTAIGLLQSVIGFILILLSNAFVRKVDNDNSLF